MLWGPVWVLQLEQLMEHSESKVLFVGKLDSTDAVYNGVPDGEFIGNDTQRNLYVTTHLYPGAGQYVLYTEDPNRNEGAIRNRWRAI